MKKIHKLNLSNDISTKNRITKIILPGQRGLTSTKIRIAKILKYFIFLVILPFFIFSNTYSEQDNAPTLTKKQSYELYTNRVTEFCSEYKENDSTSETIYLINEEDSYKEGNNIKQAKEQYRKNMDGIYDCAVSLVNLRALKLVKDLISKSPKVSSRLNSKIDQQINQVEQKISSNQKKCKVTSEKSDNIIKKSVLKQTTYEYCRYSFYLEYLKEEYNKVSVLTSSGTSTTDGGASTTGSGASIPIGQIIKSFGQSMSEIDQEAIDIVKAYPITFKSYSEYENNLAVHILLELLREEFLVLREELHKVLNPMNQVVYKIANAMKK